MMMNNLKDCHVYALNDKLNCHCEGGATEVIFSIERDCHTEINSAQANFSKPCNDE